MQTLNVHRFYSRGVGVISNTVSQRHDTIQYLYIFCAVDNLALYSIEFAMRTESEQ